VTDHPNIAAALVAALADLTVVEKGRTAKAGSYTYSYADIADVVKLTRPVLAKHGLVALTPVHDHGDDLACTVSLLHSSGERLDFGPFPFPHGETAQATGSAVTYHRRYALVSALGMAAGDDDDGASAAPRQRKQTANGGKPEADGPISAANAQALVTRCEEKGLNPHEVVSRGTDGRTTNPAEVLRSEIAKVKSALDELAGAPL
jgi:hypothetical protein